MPGVDPLATDVRFAPVGEIGDPKGTVWIKTLRHSCEAIGGSYQRVVGAQQRTASHCGARRAWFKLDRGKRRLIDTVVKEGSELYFQG